MAVKLPLATNTLIDDRWRLTRAIAKGGFAVVYDAVDETAGAPVVIKVLRDDALESDPNAAARFEREAQVAVSFEHPRVVRTLAWGRAGEIPYIVMEKLAGDTLTREMYSEPMPAERVRVYLTHILEGLEAAHERGYVHRDLKPSNVFVSGTTDAPDVKLLDFGFVKVLDEGDNPELIAPLTKMGERVGTPGYMAPEMLRKGEVTPRCDLYSVGVLGYELLTGNQAFPGEGVKRAMAQIDSDPETPGEFITKTAVWPVVKKLFDRNPKRRYQTAVEALGDLRADAAPAGNAKPKKRWFGLFGKK